MKADCPKDDFSTEFPSLNSSTAPSHPNRGKTPLQVLNPLVPARPIHRSPVSPMNNDHKKARRSSSPSLSFYGDHEEPSNLVDKTEKAVTISNEASEQQISDDSHDPDDTDKMSVETSISPQGRSHVKGTCEVAFFIDDASKEMELIGDDNLKLNTTTLTEDKLNIQMVCDMLTNIPPERKENINVAVLHVGAQNLPTKTQHEFENMFQIYQNFVGEITKECPTASIVVSSVLPRAGDDPYKEAINTCIDQFNTRLGKLCVKSEENKSRLHYLDNGVHFMDEDDKVNKNMYVDPDGEGMQINADGQNRLKSGIIDAIKAVFYQDKLVDAMNFSMGDVHATPNL